MSFLTKGKWARPVVTIAPAATRAKAAVLQTERWRLLCQIAVVEREMARIERRMKKP